jgi:hypothetical protein
LTITPPKVETRLDGPQLSIKVSNSMIDVDRKVRYSQFACKQTNAYGGTDIVLNRDELINNAVNQIAFQSASTVTDYYRVDIDKNRLILSPKSTNAFKPFDFGTSRDPLVYWFYPAGTVALSIPNAPPKADLNQAINTLAAQKNLIPVSNVVPDFIPPSQKNNLFYFIDNAGFVPDGEAGIELGMITVPQTFYGPQGAYQKPQNLVVYARKPGLLE